MYLFALSTVVFSKIVSTRRNHIRGHSRYRLLLLRDGGQPHHSATTKHLAGLLFALFNRRSHRRRPSRHRLLLLRNGGQPHHSATKKCILLIVCQCLLRYGGQPRHSIRDNEFRTPSKASIGGKGEEGSYQTQTNRQRSLEVTR